MLLPCRRHRLFLTAALPLIAIGCARDARLADHDVRDVEVRAVEHYGVKLDRDATPQQVVYVLMRAIRDDFLAETPEERKAALDVQFDVSAANEIKANTRDPLSPVETLYHVVYRWTPTLSHYAGQFETDWEVAGDEYVLIGPQLAKRGQTSIQEAVVLVELEDPSGDPSAQVVGTFQLVQDNGFWRVVQVGFNPLARSIPRPGGEVHRHGHSHS